MEKREGCMGRVILLAGAGYDINNKKQAEETKEEQMVKRI